MVFSDCNGNCIKTCANRDPVCTKECAPGCVCPDGTFLENGQCKSADDCVAGPPPVRLTGVQYADLGPCAGRWKLNAYLFVLNIVKWKRWRSVEKSTILFNHISSRFFVCYLCLYRSKNYWLNFLCSFAQATWCIGNAVLRVFENAMICFHFVWGNRVSVDVSVRGRGFWKELIHAWEPFCSVSSWVLVVLFLWVSIVSVR